MAGVGVGRMAAMTTRRKTRTIEFRLPDVEPVAVALSMLGEVGDGWVNLLPGVAEDEADVNPPTGLFSFFGTRQPPVTMATVMPPKAGRAASEGMSVGIMHPTGPKAIARLAEAGITVPDGWVVRQDHARRGLVLRTAVEAPPAEVITWCVRAGTELCRADMTGEWRAVVYLP
jgi:hypothetical protein